MTLNKIFLGRPPLPVVTQPPDARTANVGVVAPLQENHGSVIEAHDARGPGEDVSILHRAPHATRRTLDLDAALMTVAAANRAPMRLGRVVAPLGASFQIAPVGPRHLLVPKGPKPGTRIVVGTLDLAVTEHTARATPVSHRRVTLREPAATHATARTRHGASAPPARP